jgi:hypothetical protein
MAGTRVGSLNPTRIGLPETKCAACILFERLGSDPLPDGPAGTAG